MECITIAFELNKTVFNNSLIGRLKYISTEFNIK